MNEQGNTVSARRALARVQSRRRFLQFAAGGLVGTAALLAACSQASDEQTPGGEDAGPGTSSTPTVATQPGGETPTGSSTRPIVIAQGVDIASFDPHEDTSTVAIAVFRNVFNSLVERDHELNLVPALAESWQTIDELTWEFQLRRDVLFHDGNPLTSKDIKFSIERVLDPSVNSRSRTRVEVIDRVEAVDDYTVRIITREPFPPLLTILGYLYALPADKYQEMGSEQFAVSPIGTGPYKFVEWVKDDHIILERFEDHWGGSPSIPSVEFRPIPEAATRVASLLAGELDLATLIPITDIPTIEQRSDLDIRTVPSTRTIFIGMNTWNPPFDDVRVRQALNYAVDVQSIIDNLLGGHGLRIASVSGPAEFGFNPNLEPYPFDPEKAKQLLAEAGYADGFQTTLDTPVGRYLQDLEVAQAVAGYLANVGIQVEVRPAEFQEYFTRWLNLEIPGLYLLGWGASTLDADGVMGGHFHSKRRGLYYNSPESDRMIEEAMSEFDPERREAIYHELMAYLHEQAPWIFLYVQEDIYGVKADLRWQPRSDELLNVHEMSWS
ncbi:ABC transporter substrate-binding protein [Thermomicrobiaceae bacterium CFH 74404]|uniref:ABC transporter substrate-binding protein n=1 Tax=Thermalbibacter longus TaxID=2951981 RepID=A0AA41WBQ5_9BACT|nr:ABC transporter substrate-binding protein [Thermalbibacter longus]MCM8749951.1 ABC transporter substrate-binding protein [Thermalbibacter longus]